VKRIILSFILALAGSSAWAQGTVILQNSSAAFLISTNDLAVHVGVTTKTAGAFNYAVLIAAYGGVAPADNPLDAAWSGAVLTGVNSPISAGGISGQGGAAGAAAAGWGAPTAGGYTDGTEMYFIVVGWSSTLGSTWAQAKANVPFMTTADLYSWSVVGYGYAGGGPNALPAPSLWGVSAAMPGGLTSGFIFELVPEPSSFALAGLGGLALLVFRRHRHRNGN
jgi:hypothetical protein